MKAFETRSEAINPQYEAVEAKISQAKVEGKTTLVSNGRLFPEVSKRLAEDDGYDVRYKLNPSYITSYYEVSWEKAEEGRRGTVTELTDEVRPEPKKTPSIEELILTGIVLGI